MAVEIIFMDAPSIINFCNTVRFYNGSIITLIKRQPCIGQLLLSGLLLVLRAMPIHGKKNGLDKLCTNFWNGKLQSESFDHVIQPQSCDNHNFFFKLLIKMISCQSPAAKKLVHSLSRPFFFHEWAWLARLVFYKITDSVYYTYLLFLFQENFEVCFSFY